MIIKRIIRALIITNISIGKRLMNIKDSGPMTVFTIMIIKMTLFLP